jgi:hypothetical protein
MTALLSFGLYLDLFSIGYELSPLEISSGVTIVLILAAAACLIGTRSRLNHPDP